MKSEGATYQSNDLFTKAILVFFPLYFLLKIILVSSYTYSVYLLNGLISNSSGYIREDLANVLNFNASMTEYNIILLILCAISFSLWIYRANKNLSFLGIKGLEFSPALSVWCFYIPLFSFYWPFKAVTEIWKASLPISGNFGENWKKLSTPLIIPIWWVLFIGSVVLIRIISYSPPQSLPEIKVYLLKLIVIELLLTIATALIIYIAYKINENQNNKLMLINSPAPE